MAGAAVLVLGGPASPGCFLLVPVSLTGALVWSWRAGAVLSVLSVLLMGVSAALKMSGRLPTPPPNTPLGLAVVVAGALVITTVLVGAAPRSNKSSSIWSPMRATPSPRRVV